MTTWQTQLEAIGTALILIQQLPEGTVWSLTCTNDDDKLSQSVLNIFAPVSEWPALRTSLRLDLNGPPVDDNNNNPDDPQFLSFEEGTLTVSLVEES